jgi:hypothetical protein
MKIRNVLLVALLLACGKKDKETERDVTVTYTEIQDDFANPERGFFRYTQTDASNYIPLSVPQLKQWRTLQEVGSGANYSIYSTLVFRYYVLDIFKAAPLSAAFLEKFQADFNMAREAGVKLILRFTYTVTTQAGNCAESGVCPPYGDASKATMLQHIAQMKPLLQQNADVITCMQMGFIGIWGENYYTDYFGDASSNGQGKLLDNNWQDRIEILRALLDALPADRMVQVRIPQMKQRCVYGVKASVNAPALTESEGFNQTEKARIGFHNDCFLSGPDDYGTYSDMGNSSSPRQAANTILREYVKDDSKYVVVGGETCDDAYSPQNDCEAAGTAQTEMRKLHLSYLNSAYNNNVNNDWQTSGCMDKIKKEMGYRFALKDGIYPSSVQAGSELKFTINLENRGYASPYNERPVKLVMRKQGTGELFSFTVTPDIRKWFSGSIKLASSITTTAAMPKGAYDLLLSLPDKYTTIAARPEYAIRLANQDVWEQNTGFNKLNAVVTIR